MDTAEIRRRFVAHFETQRGPHRRCPRPRCCSTTRTCCSSTPAWCRSSPTSSARRRRRTPRAVSVQKCVRTLDIEEVGKTTRHGTFFQMCGNFSFGDYFKEGAIELAWELVTKPQADGGWGFDESRLYPSVYDDDDEARRAVEARSPACPTSGSCGSGKKENYWSMGVPGPGGPCSEILIDRGPRVRPGPARPRSTCPSRGPLPGDLEPGLHAGRAQRGPQQGRLRHRRPAAEEEHRHRHGPGAGRVPAAGRRQHVRDRRDVPGHREGRGARRASATARTTRTTSGSGWSPTTSAAR